MTFEAMGLAGPILRAVAAEGYVTPTPIQSRAIPQLLAGRDLLGCAQTGTGKTAAFALPILHRLLEKPLPTRGAARPIRVLVLAPTRELALQIGESFRTYGRFAGQRHTVVFGGVGQGPQTKALREGVEILVATPGRLIDLMGQGFIDLRAVEVLVLDEADRMLDMGFLPDVRRILAKVPTRRQTMLFSATIPESIERLADAITHDPVRLRMTPVRATTELIEQSVFFVSRPQKPRLLSSYLSTRAFTRALVFTRTKHGADRVVRQLRQYGIHADAIHGNKSQNARQRTLADFKENRIPVLVATDIAARGIDVDGISHVLNYDMPHEPETYVHRIGRTGRAGATGIAVSFCDDEERQQLRAIEQLLHRSLSVENEPEMTGSPIPAVSSHARSRPARTHARSGRSQAPASRRTAKPKGRTLETSAGRRPEKAKRRFGAARLRRAL